MKMDPKLLKLFSKHISYAAAGTIGAGEYMQRAAVLRAGLAPILARVAEKMAAGDKKGPEMDRLLRSGGAIIGVLHHYDKNVTVEYEDVFAGAGATQLHCERPPAENDDGVV